LWAQERGFELPAQPEGESCAVRWLCYSALLRASNPPARAAAGSQHSLFIDGEGRLSSCGSAPSYNPGMLGHGEGMTRLNTPTRLPSPLGGERAVSVSAGLMHSLALTADGAVWSWGGGGNGRLGHGDEQGQLLPKKVEALAGRGVVAVSAGSNHNVALTADGAVWSWGDGSYGMLGHGDEQHQWQPNTIEALAGQRVIAVAAGVSHSLALAADGAVWSWGRGGSGKLGHGDQQNQLLPKKIEALAGQRAVAVSAGVYHSLALTADSSVWSWGFGGRGRLGHGDEQDQLLPTKIEALTGQRVSSLCRLGGSIAAPSPQTALFGAGALEGEAGWATATSRTSCCPRRSRPSLASASSPCRLHGCTASRSPPTAPSLPGARARPES